MSSNGKKYVLGMYQASSENHQSCLTLLNDLENRGVPTDGLLFIVDGGSGLNKALNLKYLCIDEMEKHLKRAKKSGYIKVDINTRHVAHFLVMVHEGFYGILKGLDDPKVFTVLYDSMKRYFQTIET